ncbi:MAG: methyltransferase domain-containing protein [Armatimonadetes bacterium]|nr:methyltransferase domain-containing protein [Armatimonadota bacterium]
MTEKGRKTLRSYYDAAASTYLERASKGVMGWLRRRELAVTLDMIPARGSGKALDAGCGPGYYSQVLRDRGFDVTAVDLSPEMVTVVQKLGLRAYVMDIERADPPEGIPAPFGLIFCAGVLEFAEDVTRFLESLRRMADDDAALILIAPLQGLFGICYAAYLRARGIPARLYTKASVAASLRAAGFEPVEFRIARPICLAVRAKATKRSK